MSRRQWEMLEIALLMAGAIIFWSWVIFLALTAPPA